MCSDLLDPDGDVRGCSVGCTEGVWDIAPLVLIIAAGRCIGFPRTKKLFFSSRGVVRGAAEFRVFVMSDKRDRRYVSVHVACRFTLFESGIS